MNLTETQVNQILIALGYGANLLSVSDTHIAVIRNHLSNDFPDELINQASVILNDLGELEDQMKDNRDYYSVAQSSRSTVNFRQANLQLKRDASNQLKLLSALLDIPIRFNRYSVQQSPTVSYW